LPIKPELRKFYGPEWKTVTRPRILARAKNCCELCGVPNYKWVLRACGWWIERPELWFTKDVITGPWHPPSLPVHVTTHGFPLMICREVMIVLTVMHLNHISGDDRDDNLKAACQWCHLNYDLQHHAESRGMRKDQSRPLLSSIPPVLTSVQT